MRKFLALSIYFHTALFLAFTVKLIFFKRKDVFVSPSLRVDIIALPDKNPAPLPSKEEKKEVKVEEKIEKKTEIKEDPQPSIKKKLSDVKDKIFTKKEKSLEELQKEILKNYLNSNKKPKKASPKKNLAKGNVLSPGTSLEGIQKLNYDIYLEELSNHVRSQWSIPNWLSQEHYRCVVNVKIDKLGNLISKSIQSSSGISEYDSRALAAVDKANPFPKPPNELHKIIRFDGVALGFPK